jgi:quercetin dioxygenase-like cupin family protein
VIQIIEKKQLGNFKDERGILLWASQRLLDFDYKYLTIGSIEPGFKRGNHYHKKTHEKFMCIGGKIKYDADGNTTILDEGDIVDIPVNTTHTFENREKKTAYFIEFKGVEFNQKDTDTFKV